MGDFIRTQASKLVAGEPGDEVHLRDIAIRRSDRPELSPDDYTELVRLQVNTIRLAFSYHDFYDAETPDMYKEDAWRWLDAQVALARQFGIRLILQNFGVEGAQFVPIDHVPFDYSIWTDRELQNRFIKLWRAIAERYHREPQVVGFSLFFEPVVSESKEQWRSLAQRTIHAIREVDQNHVVFVERIYGEEQVRREVSGVDFAPEDAFVAVADDNVVYEFYFFERDEYTPQFAPWRADVQEARVYPDEQWLIHHRERSGLERNLPFNRDYLRFYLECQLAFGQAQGAPMAVWGCGARKTCFAEGRGGLQWLSDVVALFNTAGVHWTLWRFYGENFGIHENEAAKAVLRDALTNPIRCFG
jgi:aryl-phospho-beta-D-glucosidase BglC (GH1 family)